MLWHSLPHKASRSSEEDKTLLLEGIEQREPIGSRHGTPKHYTIKVLCMVHLNIIQ